MGTPPPPGPRPKGLSGSSLVKLIGWAWTVLAGMGLVASGFNLLMRLLMSSLDSSSFERMRHRGGFTAYMSLMDEYWLPILIVGFVLNAATLVTSILLLRRRPWTRTILQALIGGHMAMLVLVTVFQLMWAGSFMKDPDGSKIDPGFVGPALRIFFGVFIILFSAGFCFMYGLCIAGLRSAKVKAELESPAGGSVSGLQPGS